LTETREHLHLVLLDLLTGTAAVALLAAVEVRVDRGLVQHKACRQAGENRDESRPVRFAGGYEVQCHQAERTAARITSTGAGTPVHSSNDAAPWATRTSRPSTTRAPAASAARAVAVPGYGRSTRICPGPSSTRTSSRSEVALTIRSASSTSGGQVSRREKREAAGSAVAKAAAAPPSPRIAACPNSSSARTAASVE